MNVFELFGKIVVDASGATSGIDKTVGHAQNAENKLAKTFKKIGGMVAAAFSVRAIVDFGKQCTQAYATIAAEEAAFTQIMGDYADTAQAKLTAVADSTGVVSTRLTSSMTSLTAKFKGLGYGVEDATTLAADGLLIAADASAFWDMSLEESMSHLNSFINGSYEGGEAIGLFANDTQMAAYAIEKGIVADTKAWSALDEATKQATRLDYAKNMQAQSGATGQAAKESQSYANVMANLKERWRQFQGVVGKPILEKFVLPAMQKLNDFMPVLTEAVTNGIDWLSEGFDKIASYFTDVFTEDGLKLDALPIALMNMFRDVERKIPGMLANFGRTIRSTWVNSVWPSIQSAVKLAFGFDLPDWTDIETDVVNWWNGVKTAIEEYCTWTLASPDTSALEQFIAKVLMFIMTGDYAEDVTNALSDAIAGIGAAIETVKQWVTDFIGWLVEGSDGADALLAAIIGVTVAIGVFNLLLKAKTIYEGFVAAIGLVKTAFIGLNAVMSANPILFVISVIAGLIAGFIYLWNTSEGFRKFWIDAWNWICTACSDAAEDIQTALETIVSWWNTFTGSISSAIEKLKIFLGLNATPVKSAPGSSNPASTLGAGTIATGGVMGAQAYAFGFDSALQDKIPGFATGLDYVPRDNFLARLHQGEAVLTRDEADAWRGGSGRVETVLAQMANLLQDIAQNTGADRQMVLDTGALVGQLTPGIDARLGTISSRKGRGNV